MLSRHSPVTVKVSLFSKSTHESRRAALPKGSSTLLSEFKSLFQERFGRLLAHQVVYTDTEGDLITITTDAELQEALTSKVTTFSVMEQPETDLREGWELVDDPSVPRTAEALPRIRTGVQWSDAIKFWVNGEEVVIKNPSPSVTLLDWMRETRGLTGTHLGCGEGGCGICTVVLVDPSGKTVPINSCLRRLCAVDGCHIVNTQGLGSVQEGLHSVQKAIADGNGSQCGFCTPGWVMNMYALLENNASPSAEEVEQNFDGNLCRCTGYRPILTSFGEFAAGGKCCGTSTSVPRPSAMVSYESAPLHFSDPATGEEYYRPLTMSDLSEAQNAAAAAGKPVQVMCGNTAVGVVKYLTANPSRTNTVLIDLNFLPSLSTCTSDASGLSVGAVVSIAEVITQLEKVGTPAFQEYAEHIKRVASVQIRSVASWAGNVMLCRESYLRNDYSYFPSDVVVVLATAGASLSVVIDGGVPRTMDVLTLIKTPGTALVLSAYIPTAPEGSLVKTFKMMRRHVFSHAIVNFGVHLTFDTNAIVKTARVIVGGATSTIVFAGKTSAALLGKPLNQTTLNTAIAALIIDINAAPSASETDSLEYKKSVATGFLFKAFLAASDSLPSNFASANQRFTPADARPVSQGTTDFGVPDGEAPVGTWAIKQEANIQASGEAAYVSDQHVGAWFAHIVYSQQCNAKLVGMDAQEALGMPGVKDFVTASSIPKTGVNCFMGDYMHAPGTDLDHEKIFFEVNDIIPYVGAQLGLIVAETWVQAYEAARTVKQTYSSPALPVMNIADAERRGLKVPEAKLELVRSSETLANMLRGVRTARSTVRKAPTRPLRASAALSAKAGIKTGPQIHFQLETKSAVAVPTDGDSMQIFVSGQCRDLEQSGVALALGMPRSQVNVVNTRVGGGFGGKIFWQLPTCCAVAVAAHKLRRPVRFQNERRDDMQAAGTRNGIDFDYDVTFDATGKFDSCDVTLSSDAGWITGITPMLTNGGAGEADLVFNWPGGLNFTQNTFLTNKPAATAMRAPGTMQSALFAGAVVDHVAKTVGKEVEEIMELNFYQVGDKSCVNDVVFGENNFNYTIPQLWAQIKQSTQFEDRKVAVASYNKANKWTKKGLAIAPSKLNMGSSSYLMGAHVTAYVDGTVHVSTGGVEIGQGLNTKVALVVAQTLGLPVSKVRAEGGDTRMSGNNAITGGSVTSESCCNAAMQAAKELKGRLNDKLSSGMSWAEAVLSAKGEGTNLQAEGWFDGISFSATQPIYSVYGASVSEVLLDVMTGETRLERVDLLMDLGTQLDAAVDIGQVQGGFVMTLGYLFTEETKWNAQGTQLFGGTWEYKVPTAYDIPVEFNVSLLKDSPNPNAICLGAKAVAEPAMSLVLGPYLAVKQAIYAAREEFQLGSDFFQLDVPLSPEAIRTAIGVTEASMTLPAV